jgi:3-hydroxyacyl-CoA dehydrogenase
MMDALGPAWFAGKLKEEGHRPCPRCCPKVGDGTFYRIRKRQAPVNSSALDGKYHDVKRPDPACCCLSDIKLASKPVLKNASASKVWDIGDGVLCFEKTSKMNTFDEQIFDLLEESA